MGKIILTKAQKTRNVKFECCPKIKTILELKRQSHERITGRTPYYFHCCYCEKSTTLKSLEPIEPKSPKTKFWCRLCEEKFYETKNEEFVIIEKEELSNNSEEDSKTLSVDEENDLKIFNLDDESIEKSYHDNLSIFTSNLIKDLQQQVIDNRNEFIKCREEYEIKIEELERDVVRHRNENNLSWKKANKLIKELDYYYLKEELEKKELVKDRHKKRRYSV